MKYLRIIDLKEIYLLNKLFLNFMYHNFLFILLFNLNKGQSKFKNHEK